MDVEEKTFSKIIVMAAVMLLILPFITTFNEMLTKAVMNIGLYRFIEDYVVPPFTRVVGGVLRYVCRIPTVVSEDSLYLLRKGMPIEVYISWNCVGWQSFILFAVTLLTGLQGPYTTWSKVKCLAVGLEGTALLNVFRVALTCVLLYYVGYLPALVFHDYLGTVLTLVWLAVFWYVSFEHLLKRRSYTDNGGNVKAEHGDGGD